MEYPEIFRIPFALADLTSRHVRVKNHLFKKTIFFLSTKPVCAGCCWVNVCRLCRYWYTLVWRARHYNDDYLVSLGCLPFTPWHHLYTMQLVSALASLIMFPGYLTFNRWFSTFGVLWYAKETSSSSRYIFYLTVVLITFLLSTTRIMTRLLNLGRIINASINASMIAWLNSGLPGSALNYK